MRDEDDIWGLVAAAVGVFAVVSAFTDWGLFWKSKPAPFLVNLFGKTRARVFYVIIGGLCIAAGAFILLSGR